MSANKTNPETDVVLSEKTLPRPRRYDVDWLRTLALGLLIIYHVVLSFQPWAAFIKFPVAKTPLEGIWPLMAMINIWRIPILFMISGMGVRFAMDRRNMKMLAVDRTVRILIPWIFGIFCLNPVFFVLLPKMGWRADYMLNMGHLWFLLNIYLYCVCLIGVLFYLKDHPDNKMYRFFARVMKWRAGIFLFALPLIVETLIARPQYFSMYVDTAHGWLMGLVCFCLGFIFISMPDEFWPAVKRVRWPALGMAFALYLVRLLVFKLEMPFKWIIAFESTCWMFGILGFASIHLNKRSKGLRYFSRAVYPVYIVHMPVQFLLAYVLFPRISSVYLNLTLMLVGTFGISLVLYEIIRRIKWIRLLFGISFR